MNTSKIPTSVELVPNAQVPFTFLREMVNILGGQEVSWEKKHYEFFGYTWEARFKGVGGQEFAVAFKAPYQGARIVETSYGNKMTASHPVDAERGAHWIVESLRRA